MIPGKLAGVRKPTAALDSKSGRDVVGIMQQLVKEQGCAVLMVTRDNRILDIADRIVHMEDGQFMHSRVALGRVKEVEKIVAENPEWDEKSGSRQLLAQMLKFIKIYKKIVKTV